MRRGLRFFAQEKKLPENLKFVSEQKYLLAHFGPQSASISEIILFRIAKRLAKLMMKISQNLVLYLMSGF